MFRIAAAGLGIVVNAFVLGSGIADYTMTGTHEAKWLDFVMLKRWRVDHRHGKEGCHGATSHSTRQARKT